MNLQKALLLAVPTLQEILAPISSAVIAGGALWAVWGAIKLAMSLHNHSGGNDIRDAILQIVGGMVIGVAAGLLRNITIS